MLSRKKRSHVFNKESSEKIGVKYRKISPREVLDYGKLPTDTYELIAKFLPLYDILFRYGLTRKLEYSIVKENLDKFVDIHAQLVPYCYSHCFTLAEASFFQNIFMNVANYVEYSPANNLKFVNSDFTVLAQSDHFQSVASYSQSQHHTQPNYLQQINQVTNLCHIDCGYGFAIGLTNLGKVYSVGYNNCGQLGTGEESPPDTFQQLKLEDIVGVSCGDSFTFAWDVHHKVYCWGTNIDGRLGIKPYPLMKPFYTPAEATFLSTINIQEIICYDTRSFAITTDGKVWAWGSNNNAQLGLGFASSNFTHQPQRVAIENISSISPGPNHTLALDKKGVMWAWGENDYGKLGIGNSQPCVIPTKIQFPKTVSGILAVNDSSVALTHDREVYFWGKNCGNIITSKHTINKPLIVDNLTFKNVATSCILNSSQTKIKSYIKFSLFKKSYDQSKQKQPDVNLTVSLGVS